MANDRKHSASVGIKYKQSSLSHFRTELCRTDDNVPGKVLDIVGEHPLAALRAEEILFAGDMFAEDILVTTKLIGCRHS